MNWEEDGRKAHRISGTAARESRRLRLRRYKNTKRDQILPLLADE